LESWPIRAIHPTRCTSSWPIRAIHATQCTMSWPIRDGVDQSDVCILLCLDQSETELTNQSDVCVLLSVDQSETELTNQSDVCILLCILCLDQSEAELTTNQMCAFYSVLTNQRLSWQTIRCVRSTLSWPIRGWVDDQSDVCVLLCLDQSEAELTNQSDVCILLCILSRKWLNEFDGHRKDNSWVLFGRNLAKCLKVAELKGRVWLVDDVCGVLEGSGRLLFTLGRYYLQKSNVIHYKS